MTNWIKQLTIGAAMSVIAASAGAQAYPARPITAVVPVTVGTGADVIIRLISPEMTKRLGQAIVVENRTGASGNLGIDYVVKAKPDGYTVLIGTVAMGIAPALFPDLKWNPSKDLVPIGMLADVPMAFTVNSAVPANNVAEFVALARRQAGAFNYASPGNGTPPHISMEMFKQVAKVPLNHVPYKGNTGTVIDTVAGRVEVGNFAFPSVQQFVAEKKLRILASHSEERLPWAPDTPTLRELGFGAAEVVPLWVGVFAPAGTPQAVIDLLSRTLQEVMSEPNIKKELLDRRVLPVWKSGKEMEAILARDVVRWGRVVKDANIKAE